MYAQQLRKFKSKASYWQKKTKSNKKKPHNDKKDIRGFQTEWPTEVTKVREEEEEDEGIRVVDTLLLLPDWDDTKAVNSVPLHFPSSHPSLWFFSPTSPCATESGCFINLLRQQAFWPERVSCSCHHTRKALPKLKLHFQLFEKILSTINKL